MQVSGRALFPGAGMLEAARAAATCLLPFEQVPACLLTGITISSPIILPAEVISTFQATTKPICLCPYSALSLMYEACPLHDSLIQLE